MACNFRENLRNELNYQGVTIKELSARTGIPVATLDCYLGTRATMPSAETAVKIAQALHVTVEYLVLGENPDVQNTHSIPSRETRDIINLAKTLNREQCKAILEVVNTFKTMPLNRKYGA